MKRFTTLPTTLYRLQSSLRFKLKEKEATLSKKRKFYDYVQSDEGLYVPRSSITHKHQNFQPNGVELFSMCKTFQSIIVGGYKNLPRYYYVIEIPEGTPLPEQTVLLQDPVEQYLYWLETETPTQPSDFNAKIELLLLGSKIHRKKEYRPIMMKQLQKNNQKDQQDNRTDTNTQDPINRII